MLALVASLLLLAQGLVLFGPAPGRVSEAQAAASDLAQLVGVDAGQAVICLTDDGMGGHGTPSGKSAHGDCPLCVAFGCATPPPPAAVAIAPASPPERLAFVAALDTIPHGPQNRAARSRAPPTLG